jgi:hypothetical protein
MRKKRREAKKKTTKQRIFLLYGRKRGSVPDVNSVSCSIAVLIGRFVAHKSLFLPFYIVNCCTTSTSQHNNNNKTHN